eukprot:3806228-Pleurochrysis_carterae.AAC.1
MTNSCSMHVPAMLSPVNFKVKQLCARTNPFLNRLDLHAMYAVVRAVAVPSPFGSQRLSMTAFTSKFNYENAKIVALKAERFTTALKPSALGALFERLADLPAWCAHMTYHQPM